jgi:anaerobic dimethyl sulfoxide reductase subunit B (iron-sulfur subunit)
VQACPYRALDFGPLDELQQAHGTFNAPAPLPDPSITKPSIVYNPNKVTKLIGDKSGSVKNLEEV